ncbi:hypothetical protein RCL1_004253 [Eukaryota sp. TZLM3-RCL]
MYAESSLGPPLVPPPVVMESQFDRFRRLVAQYEISETMAMYLRQLEHFDTVLICDDSGSMSTPIQPHNSSSPPTTRWAELKSQVAMITDLVTCFDDDGIDLYFLNRPGRGGITQASDLNGFFCNPPAGVTPLADALNRVIQDKAAVLNSPERQKKLLIIIFTDGIATDKRGHVDMKSFERALKSRPDCVFTTIVICTDDDDVVNIYNRLDRTVKNLDVVDDYVSERNEIRRAQGSNYSFTLGDYVVKCLMGSIVPELDTLDQSSGCCSMM